MRSVLNQRHILVGCMLAAVLAAGILIGIAFTATTSEAAQAARSFTTPTGMILNYVKRGSTNDFEFVMGKLGEALQTSEAPNRKEQARGWKVYRAREAGPNNSVLYVWFVDPAVGGADYAVSQIISEAFPAEAQQLYETFNGSFAGGQAMVNLELIESF